MPRFAAAVLALLLCSPVAAQELRPARKVEANAVISADDPALTITLPTSVRYVGADRWLLYDVADAELHVFVEADTARKVSRAYWIQFEAIVPAKPESTYNYERDPATTIAGLTFNVRARFGPTDEPTRPGSDLEHLRRLLTNAGYTLPAEVMNVSLVHLPTADRRKELMIIYMEDLAHTGMKAAQLVIDGKPAPEWTVIEKDLIDRVRDNITFTPRD